MDVQLQLMEGASFFGLLQDPDQRPAALAIGFVPTKVEYFDPYSELHSEGYSNLSSYDSEFVDSLITALRATQDSTVRRSIYSSLQRSVRDDVPAIYAIYVPRVLAVGPSLGGVRMSAGGPFAFVSEWTIER